MLPLLFSCVAGIIETCTVVVEPPQFWAAIANDPSIERATRRMAVIRLFDRHAQPGMTLTAFARLLDNPQWLHKRDFTNWNEAVIGGWIPLAIDRQNSTSFCFRVFPGIPGDSSAVYFRVSGRMDVDRLCQLFHGQKPARFTEATILEIAASAGRDRLHWQTLNQR